MSTLLAHAAKSHFRVDVRVNSDTYRTAAVLLMPHSRSALLTPSLEAKVTSLAQANTTR